MDKKLQRIEGADSARRRLIKGSFAVPALLTVASGSALARTSSRCIAREAASGGTATFDSADATWQRVLSYTYKKPGDKSVRSYWIRFEELNSLAFLAGVEIKNSWIVAGQALCVETGDAPTGAAQHLSGSIYSTSTPLTLPPLTSSLTAGFARYYAIIIDVDGNIIGISQKFTASGQSGGTVHKSCWNSFKVV